MSCPARVALLLLCFTCAGVRAADLKSPRYFDQSVRPLLSQYCFPCHSSEKHKGDFDMERFVSLAEVKQHPKIWQEVLEKLTNEEMPPREKPQPSVTERDRLSKWLLAVLGELAARRAGDPGPVVLRRLSNAEYTYTLQDLTGVTSLQPAREFPVDGAAGEGFMNTGQALVMSSSLLSKYLDAGKEIAGHAVLLPDGIRFSAKTTRRDWTEELLAQIRDFYRRYSDPHGGDKVNLQGIVFETNEGGRLPVEKYLAATLAEREALASGRKSPARVVQEQGLNAKYFQTLFAKLSSHEPSLLLDHLRNRWRTATPEQAAELATEVGQWQKALWKFNTVGHIGKAGGPKSWMEPVNPLVAKQEVRLKLAPPADAKEVALFLVASDAGDGNENDFVTWERPRLVAPGRPDLLLRDVRGVSRELAGQRRKIFASASKCLAAAAEAGGGGGKADLEKLSAQYQVEIDALGAWLDYLGIGKEFKIDSYFTNQIKNASNYDFIKGWGTPETPLLMANSSDQHVRVPGNMKPHSVAVHPSPTLQAAVAWRSPVTIVARVDAAVTHAHPECGNGITWALELRRGATRQRLAGGATQGGKEVKAGPFEKLALQRGDYLCLLIGPRDGNHACDLTAVDLSITDETSGASANPNGWNLAADISGNVLAGNPHADHLGNEGVWHFFTEPDNGGNGSGPTIPTGSLLAKWQSASTLEEKQQLADELQKFLAGDAPAASDTPDEKLYRQLASLGGPLYTGMRARALSIEKAHVPNAVAGEENWGLDPGVFGRFPDRPRSGQGQGSPGTEPGQADQASLYVRAPSMIEVRLPADLAAGSEFVTTGSLEPQAGAEGSVQLQVLTTRPERESGLLASAVTQSQANGPWTSDNRKLAHSTPVVVNEGSRARQRFQAAFDDFRDLFPTALCYTKIVPVDEAVTLTLYYREDDQLARLMLDESQKAELDRLWDQLHFVSQDAIMLVDAFEQLWQYATQDADPKVFEPLRKPIQDRAAAFRQRLIDTEPKQLQGALDFARQAYRRPLSGSEQQELQQLYRKLRQEEIPHEQAIRLLLARILVAPAFLYRAETPGPGKSPAPLNDWELATRLSYFLWSSAPDEELAKLAAAGKLRQPKILAGQARRMLRDARVRRLAVEFACQWLHIHDFDSLDEKSERHFPTFAALRPDMYEEAILFFTDLFQRNGAVLDIVDADYTYLNEALAKHYGIPGVTGAQWRRVDGVKKFSRGGILGEGAVLAKQSGASRTSPILRGNWVSEVLLGDKLPKPPKDVPKLPEDEATENLTVRELTEKHTTDPRCAGCHVRIDAFGFALEGFDAIGRHRDRDLGNRAIDTRAKVLDGTAFEGMEGLRDYLKTKRQDAFLRQFCRKLLGYALGRSVQLSDEPLLNEMRAHLAKNDDRIGTLVESIVLSRQFREIRGREMAYDE